MLEGDSHSPESLIGFSKNLDLPSHLRPLPVLGPTHPSYSFLDEAPSSEAASAELWARG